MNIATPSNRKRQITDLAELIEREEATGHVVAAVAPTEAKAEPRLNDVFTHFLQYKSRIEALAAEQATFESELLGRSFTDVPRTEDLRELARRSLSALVYRAEQAFAPSGGKLSIDPYEVTKQTDQYDWEEKFCRTWRDGDHRSTQPLDLDAVWKYLEETYGGDAGIKAGYKQQASFLIKELNLGSKDGMKRTSSAVIAVRRLYSEKATYGANKGMFEVHYGSRESLNNLFCAIACFAEWAELDSLAIAAHPCRHPIGNYHFAFESRDKHSFPGLEVVFFKERMEFRFSHDVADKLRLFLGSFGI